MMLAGLRSEVEELKALCERNEEILIFGHKDADGDTLGCSLAFAEALRLRGRRRHQCQRAKEKAKTQAKTQAEPRNRERPQRNQGSWGQCGAVLLFRDPSIF